MMEPKRNKQRTPQNYDPELLENWTLDKLKHELSRLGASMPANTRRFALIRKIRAIRAEHNTAHDSQSSEAEAEALSQNPPNINNNNGGENQTDSMTKQEFLDILARMETRMDSRIGSLATTMETMTENIDLVASRVDSIVTGDRTRINDRDQRQTSAGSGAVQRQEQTTSLQNPSILSIQQTNRPRKRRYEETTLEDEEEGNTLASAYDQMDRFRVNNVRNASAAAGSEQQLIDQQAQTQAQVQYTEFGYPAHTMNLVETVTPAIRRRIIQGRDINLATLMIPYYAGPDNNQTSNTLIRPDPRLSRSLTIEEFIMVFSIYKFIICNAHPRRRIEMDLYERDVVDMASRYSGYGFYEYHRQFSLNSASRLIYTNVPVDWSVRDNTLFCNIFANLTPKACIHCNSTLHWSGFCDSHLQSAQIQPYQHFNYPQHYPIPTQSSTRDRSRDNSHTSSRERNNSFHNGVEICFKYNGERGCDRVPCNFLHVCLNCRNSHPRSRCPHAKKRGNLLQSAPVDNRSKPKHFPTPTPINLDQLKKELLKYPDQELKNILLQGIKNGFHTGIQELPQNSIICKNSKAATNEPECVTKLVKQELEKGYVIGPYDYIPFDNFRINPIGLAEGKYSKKKRLIVDLSAPHDDTENPSLNDLIDKNEFSLQYVTIDDAIKSI